jgi:hypothetical protein
VVPFDSADTYPTHDEKYGKGGYRTVADNTERDAIPADRRVEGMLVFSIADGVTYQLQADLTTWGTFSAGGGGAGSPYSFVIYFPDKPADGQALAVFYFANSVRFPANLVNSKFFMGTPPTADTTFNLQKNGTTFATVTFHSVGAPTVVAAADTDFNGGSDLFALVAPSPMDATGALPSFTLALTLL